MQNENIFKIQYRCKRCPDGLAIREKWYCDKCLEQLMKKQNKLKQI